MGGTIPQALCKQQRELSCSKHSIQCYLLSPPHGLYTLTCELNQIFPSLSHLLLGHSRERMSKYTICDTAVGTLACRISPQNYTSKMPQQPRLNVSYMRVFSEVGAALLLLLRVQGS